MAKADLSDDVIKVGILAILVGGVYLVYVTAGRGEPVTTIIQKPATWVASGSEYWGQKLWELPSDIVKAVDPDPDRTLLGYDEGSLLWGYGPKGTIKGKWYNPFD